MKSVFNKEGAWALACLCALLLGSAACSDAEGTKKQSAARERDHDHETEEAAPDAKPDEPAEDDPKDEPKTSSSEPKEEPSKPAEEPSKPAEEPKPAEEKPGEQASKPQNKPSEPAQPAEPKPEDKPSEPMQPTTPPPKTGLYAVSGYVFSDDTENTYINVIKSLETTKIDIAKALEIPGRASIAAHGKYLFVAEGEAPVIRRYTVSDSGELKLDGRISFAAYGLTDISVDDWSNIFISSKKAYLSDFDSGNLIIWNPSEMVIEGELELPEFTRKGLDLDGSTPVLVGKYLLRAIFWRNWDEYVTSDEQYLAIIDTESDKLVDMVRETRCPALSNRVDRDEEGNLYFSNWIYNVTETLVADAPSSCALRIKAGERSFDPEWKLEFPKYTEGREAAGLSYIKDGKAFLSVFHAERATIDADTDPNELAQSSNWRLWSIDLKTQTGAPVEGLDFAGGGYSLIEVDGRTLLMQPTDDYDKTEVYEVTEGTKLTKRFDVAGFSYQITALK